MAVKSVLKYPEIVYTPTVSDTMFNLREARAEYSRLRKIAEKRLKRIAAAGLDSSKQYRRYKDAFAPLPRGVSEGTVRKMLSEVAHYLETATSSVTGIREQRKKTLQSLKDKGYEFLTDENLDQFSQFIDRVRNYKSSRAYDSEEIIDLFKEANKLGADPLVVADNFEEYMSGKKKVADLVTVTDEDEAALAEMQTLAPLAAEGSTKKPKDRQAPARKETPMDAQQRKSRKAKKAKRKQANESRKRNRK